MKKRETIKNVSGFLSWIFIFVGSKNKKREGSNDEIDQFLVSGAVDDTKTIGKAGADIFANCGAEKP